MLRGGSWKPGTPGGGSRPDAGSGGPSEEPSPHPTVAVSHKPGTWRSCLLRLGWEPPAVSPGGAGQTCGVMTAPRPSRWVFQLWAPQDPSSSFWEKQWVWLRGLDLEAPGSHLLPHSMCRRGHLLSRPPPVSVCGMRGLTLQGSEGEIGRRVWPTRSVTGVPASIPPRPPTPVASVTDSKLATRQANKSRGEVRGKE